jgi:hypothetical protein
VPDVKIVANGTDSVLTGTISVHVHSLRSGGCDGRLGRPSVLVPSPYPSDPGGGTPPAGALDASEAMTRHIPNGGDFKLFHTPRQTVESAVSTGRVSAAASHRRIAGVAVVQLWIR